MRGYKYLRVPLKGYDKGTTRVPLEGSIRVLYLFGGLIIRILPFRVLYWGPPFFGNSHLERREAIFGLMMCGLRLPERIHLNIGALIIRIGCWGPLYDNYGNSEGPYIREKSVPCLRQYGFCSRPELRSSLIKP